VSIRLKVINRPNDGNFNKTIRKLLVEQDSTRDRSEILRRANMIKSINNLLDHQNFCVFAYFSSWSVKRTIRRWFSVVASRDGRKRWMPKWAGRNEECSRIHSYFPNSSATISAIISFIHQKIWSYSRDVGIILWHPIGQHSTIFDGDPDIICLHGISSMSFYIDTILWNQIHDFPVDPVSRLRRAGWAIASRTQNNLWRRDMEERKIPYDRILVFHANNVSLHGEQAQTPNPPYSPNLGRSNFSLFGSAKKRLRGDLFTNREICLAAIRSE
jgi:hypothetical protein